ncbi:hypothetical protein UT4_12630 [Ferrigenium sp. UT4]
MKLKTSLLAATLAAFAAATAYANDEHHSETKADAPKVEKTEAKKPVKRHNHMEEKTGMPMSESGEKPGDMPNMDMHEHMKMHDHTKDRH